MSRDTLPLHQTLSIFSMFFMMAAIGMMSYAITDTFWLQEKLNVRTQYIGIALKNSLPQPSDLIPDAGGRDCGNSIQSFAKALANNTRGRLFVDGQIGLKRFCIYLRAKNFGPFTDLLPDMHYCRPYDVWENFGQKRMLSGEGEQLGKKLFDKAIDVADKVHSIMKASLAIIIIATVSTFLKTPLISNFLKSRKIFQAASFFLVLIAVIITTWGIVFFVRSCDPKQLIDHEKAEQIKLKHSEDIWRHVRTQQQPGRCFYMAIAVDCVLVLVLLLSAFEYILRATVTHDYSGLEMDEDLHERLLAFEEVKD